MTAKACLLLVEDTPSILQLYHEVLARLDVVLIDADTGAGAHTVLRETVPDVVLLDLELPDIDGFEILRAIKKRGLPSAVIVVTGHGSVKTAVEAMREGAYDFIIKPFAPDRLLVTVRNAIERRHLESLAVANDIAKNGRFFGFIGASLPMRAVYNVIESTAKSRATVFITGESGTGKELCAQAIHLLSPRRDGPFVAVNCGAIPRELMESEMFGHVKGAFTGATTMREGALGGRAAARYCSTRSARWIWRSKSSCCACCNRASSPRWVAARSNAPMCAICAPRTATRGSRSRPAGCERTFITVSTSYLVRCRRCASATAMYCRWHAIFLHTTPRKRARLSLTSNQRRLRR
jgi:CheY-like chemotaxis protein